MDHCTLFPEGWWGHCCRQHDIAYDLNINRFQADVELLQCVVGTVPESLTDYTLIGGGASLIIGLIMFIGVRTLGSFFFKK